MKQRFEFTDLETRNVIIGLEEMRRTMKPDSYMAQMAIEAVDNTLQIIRSQVSPGFEWPK